jgi:hypothetical protein
MRLGSRLLVRSTIVAATAALALSTAVTSGFAGTLPTGPPSATPALGTPHLVNTGTTEQIRQLVQCGSTMYAVGTFTEIAQGSTTYTREGAFSFSAAAPYTMTSWDPEVNGTVNSIGFNGANCSDAYLGGTYSSIGGAAVKNIAEVDTTTGAVVTAFKSSASGEVDTILGWNGHLFTGGKFTSINGSSADPYFTSLSPTTGKNDGYLNLSISGNYVFTDAGGNPSSTNPTRVYNQQLSNAGTRLLVEGDFTTIGGQPRQQVAMLDLGATTATTDAWYAQELSQDCATSEPFYAQAAAWSPDDSTIYIATTGYKPANGPGYYTYLPRTGDCDAAVAFPSTAGQVSHSWINYTGCDSLYSVAADASTAYFAGHERWASNPYGCDNAGPGAVTVTGFEGLSPADGSLTFNPTRARGEGADDMIVTPEGLWIASDNYENSVKCGGVSNLAGICLLPYVG